MHIKKFDSNYSRRFFMKQVATGALATGVLAPLWSTIAMGRTLEGVYPDEISSFEGLTKGKINNGDVINANNVDFLKDYMDEVAFMQVKEMGREIDTHATTMDPSFLSPPDYLNASVKNSGRATFNADGNVATDDGTAWIGGNPFPDAKNGTEAFANITMSWGRYDNTFYAIQEDDLNPDGSVAYSYDFAWIEQQATGRVSDPDGPYFKGSQEMVRFQTAWFNAPQDVKGTAFLSSWPYDQRQFPKLEGYLPAFKRVRRFPTNQRFEPLLPGPTWYLSDAWGAGDPWLTWGNFKIVHRGPMVGPAGPGNFNSKDPNWKRERVGGPQGTSFFRSDYEVIPDVVVIECEPTGYPRAPISKRRVYIDARTMVAYTSVSYDRQGKVYKNFEHGNGMSIDKDGTVTKAYRGGPLWTWNFVIIHDVQTGRISLPELVKEMAGGYPTHYDDTADYDRYLTKSAIRRLGA